MNSRRPRKVDLSRSGRAHKKKNHRKKKVAPAGEFPNSGGVAKPQQLCHVASTSREFLLLGTCSEAFKRSQQRYYPLPLSLQEGRLTCPHRMPERPAQPSCLPRLHVHVWTASWLAARGLYHCATSYRDWAHIGFRGMPLDVEGDFSRTGRGSVAVRSRAVIEPPRSQPACRPHMHVKPWQTAGLSRPFRHSVRAGQSTLLQG
jgi:hypothetical protein